MIHCGSCGAANRDAGRFCSECGAALPSAAGLRCPMCGVMNPPGNVFCDSCGARVVPMTAASPEPKPSETPVVKKGLSLPTKPSGELPATGPAASARLTPPAPAPPPAQPAAPGESDDWLSRLRGTLPTEQHAEAQPRADESVPDWLRDLGSEPAAQGAQAVSPVFDLAARLGGVEPSEPAPTPAEPEVPDWIARLGTPAAKPSVRLAAQGAEPEMPDWLAGKPSTPRVTKSPAPATPSAEAEVPDWLKPPSPAPTSAAEVEIPDWLKPPSPAPMPAVEAEAPDWLQQTPPAPVEAEASDWLSQLAPTPTITEPSAPTASSLESEVPDWLAQLPSAPVAATPSALAIPPVEPEAPDWLSQLAPSATEEPSASAESPDWALYPTTQAPPTTAMSLVLSEPEAVPSIESEAPDWLAQLSPLAVAPEPEPSPVAKPVKPGPALIGEQVPEPEETPAWLADMGGPGPAPAAPVLTEMPDWLKELEAKPSPVPSELETESPSPFAEPVVLPPGEMPAWLQELKPVEAATPTPEGLAGAPMPPAPGEGGLVAAQLPSWLLGLGPKEPSVVAAPKIEEEPAETEGTLAGVRGALPAAPIALQMSGAGISVSPEIPAGDLAGAGALQELLARGMTAVVRREGESRARRLEGKVWRWLVMLFIALAVIVPLVPGVGLSLVSAPALPKAGDDMHKSIEGLGPGAQVLVAFDYDATQAPEMDMIARVVMRHLVARQAHIEVVSLYPAGPAVAQVVINSMLPVTSPVKMDVTNRGYWPGQTTAVASLVTELRDKPLDMVIELAATPDTLRWWVEQMTGRPQKLLAGVSASVEPVAQPYAASPQLKGLLAGVPGAIAYQFKLRGTLPQNEQHAERPADLLAPLNSIAVANVALVFVMIFGGVIQLLSGRGSPSGDGRRRE